MPVVRIDVLQGYSDAQRTAIGDCVQRDMVQTLDIVLVEHERPDWSFGRGEASYVVLPEQLANGCAVSLADPGGTAPSSCGMGAGAIGHVDLRRVGAV
jgi:hypothetical protein